MKTRLGYWIAGALIAAGVAGAAIWFFSSVSNISDKIEAFTRVNVGETATVRLEAHKYVVYFEGPSGDDTRSFAEVTVTGANGTTLPTPVYFGSLTYSLGGRQGSARVTVTPPADGEYRIQVSGASAGSPANIALGESIARPLVRSILGAVAVGAIFGLAGIAMLATTIVRRYNARQPPPPPTYGLPPPPHGQMPSPGAPPREDPPPAPSLWSG